MNDWVACEQCNTFYEYDPVRRVAQCPYCKKRQDDRAEPRKTADVREPTRHETTNRGPGRAREGKRAQR
jgi:hypothetical protein